MTILQSNNHFHATLGMTESTFPISKEKKKTLAKASVLNKKLHRICQAH